MEKKYINAFYIQDKERESGKILIPFSNVKFIFVDETSNYYNVTCDGITFNVTKEEYDFYVHYIKRRY